jgi:hypothetical protein
LQLFQPGDLGLGEWFVTEVDERRAAPEHHRLVEQLHRLCRITRGERVPALEDELLELGDIELRRENSQRVARSRGDETARRQHSPQP